MRHHGAMGTANTPETGHNAGHPDPGAERVAARPARGTGTGASAPGGSGAAHGGAEPGAGLGDVDIAPVAGMFADGSRARVLTALADGRALPASLLAAEAGLSPQGVSAHLAKLRDAGLVEVEKSGRNRYYRLSGPAVANAIEALARLAPARPVRSLREGTRAQALRAGRTCYDHLAGRLGTAITAALLDQGGLTATDGEATTRRRAGDPLSARLPGHPYELGPRAGPVFATLGVDLPALRTARSRRPLLRFCLDWTEQRHHLSGRLGAALTSALLEAGWLSRAGRPQRAVRLTESGAAALSRRLALRLD